VWETQPVACRPGREHSLGRAAGALGVGTLRVQPQSQSHPDRIPSGAQQRHRAVDTAAHRDRHAARHGCGLERRAERIRKGVHGQLVASDGGGLEKVEALQRAVEPFGVSLEDPISVDG
jgi:hypothetical protein